MNRRTLLKYLALQTLTLPFVLQAKPSSPKMMQKRLILIELKGGNDGLNTVIPYANEAYYALRPTLAIAKEKVLKLNANIGLHPSLAGLKEIYDNKELAIIQGVGYPQPNRSHFRSIEIWDTASKSQEYLDKGWLNTLALPQDKSLKGVILGGEYGPLSGMSKGIINLHNIQGFLQQSKQVHARITLVGDNNALRHILDTESEVKKGAEVLRQVFKTKKELPYAFKKSNFHRQMQTTTELINSGVNIPFFKVSLGSFDTHTNQANKHKNLLKELSQSIDIMRKNLIESGEWNNTVIMTYSEFGRRAAENASKGTDHGTAAAHFILGGNVQGGIYGEHPSLTDLDGNKDLIYTTDFRNMYVSVADSWLNVSSAVLSPFTPIKQLSFSKQTIPTS